MHKILTAILLNKEKSDISWLFIAFALCFYALVAYKSSGFIHADEHYQIVEFANYKLGLLSKHMLAWEYASKVRPGVQPFLCYAIFKFFALIGVSDPYNLALGLRVFTATASVFVIRYFINAYREDLGPHLFPYFVCLSYFLWFLPYINVRFSSETWSGLFLTLTLAQIKRYGDKLDLRSCADIGLLLGMAIVFRFQSALCALGIVLWMAFIKKARPQSLAAAFLAVGFVLCLGVAADYWLYGTITFSPYNYFVVNLVQGKASTFGTAPFYAYLNFILSAPGPFGIIILASLVLVCCRDAKNPIVWIAAPFLVVHSLIPHKELRFIFPLINFCPLVCTLGFQGFRDIWPNLAGRMRYSVAVLALAIFLLLADTAGLVAVATTGAGANFVSVCEYIHRHYDTSRTKVIFNGDLWIYYDMPFAKNSYYSSDGINTDRIINIWQSDLPRRKLPGSKNILVIFGRDITGPRSLKQLRSLGLTRVYQNISPITEMIYDIYDRGLNRYQIFVYEFTH